MACVSEIMELMQQIAKQYEQEEASKQTNGSKGTLPRHFRRRG